MTNQSPTYITITQEEAGRIATGCRALLARADELEMTSSVHRFHEDVQIFHELLSVKLAPSAEISLYYSGSEVAAVLDSLDEVADAPLRSRFLSAG